MSVDNQGQTYEIGDKNFQEEGSFLMDEALKNFSFKDIVENLLQKDENVELLKFFSDIGIEQGKIKNSLKPENYKAIIRE